MFRSRPIRCCRNRRAAVTRETVDQGYAVNRQRFLTEQGYSYNVIDAMEL
ncbi:MAG: hypothetical protein ACLFRT_13625 [Actinomycetota bacterium]